jgi:hypothetical protein
MQNGTSLSIIMYRIAINHLADKCQHLHVSLNMDLVYVGHALYINSVFFNRPS